MSVPRFNSRTSVKGLEGGHFFMVSFTRHSVVMRKIVKILAFNNHEYRLCVSLLFGYSIF